MRFSSHLPVTTAILALASAALHASAARSSPRTSCQTDSHPDRVHTLPGFNQPLPSAWYSGLLDYTFQGQTVHTHYVLIEAEDLGDGTDGSASNLRDATASRMRRSLEKREDDDDRRHQHERVDGHATSQDETEPLPLLYWTNGGPGASSMYGLLTELGPLWLNDLSLETEEYRKTGIPAPLYNPFGWSRLGHLLIIDQPAPIGYSYCNDDKLSHSCGGLVWNDTMTADNAYLALQAFYERHPCYKDGTDLYLTGESYAGVYIPMLAKNIVDGNEVIAAREESPILLKGIAVGDGCMGTKSGVCGSDFSDIFWHIVFFAGHGQIPWSTYQEILQACSARLQKNGGNAATNDGAANSEFENNDNDNRGDESDDDDECQKMIQVGLRQLGGFYSYNLYDDCTYRNGLMKTSSIDWKGNPEASRREALAGSTANGYPCGGGPVMEQYLALPAVKEALHVPGIDFFSVDDAGGDFDYEVSEEDVTGTYSHLQTLPGFKILIYDGDTDPAITTFHSQNWTSSIGLAVEEEWRPWTIDGCRRMAGYTVKYEGDFEFLTIRGAGHMVPTYKPEASFVFLESWLKGTEYPRYDADCTEPSARGTK